MHKLFLSHRLLSSSHVIAIPQLLGLKLKFKKVKGGLMNSSPPRALPVLTLVHGAIRLVINELMQKLSKSLANLRGKKAVHCTHNDRLSPPAPEMSQVSHVKNVCAQSSTDPYLYILQLTKTWAQSVQLMNENCGKGGHKISSHHMTLTKAIHDDTANQ